MQVVCLIKPSPPTIAFVNRIHRRHPLTLVVVEENSSSRSRIPFVVRLRESVSSYGWLTTMDMLMERFRPQRDPIPTYDRLFGDDWRELNSNIPIFEVDNINSDSSRAKLDEVKPDLLLDHGTSIVRPHILDTAPLALNLHWGLSPYYRGINCTSWALVNWDPFNIGVTIHKLARQIDGGDVVAQRRATITENDDAHAINMQLTHLGTNLMIRILDHRANGGELTFQKQDLSAGFVTLSRQWSRHWANHVRFIEKNGVIGKMLKTPARKHRLPIVEFSE